ncbi:hypothetical protein A0256_13155 [Mucilaginibacter sp. PAMC 26640]|nr:hypothetical protein A0256_13155 [Mucilaginibacter sp. PAMC 26640]
MPKYKIIAKAFLLAITILSLAACKDDLNGNGTINVKVIHQELQVGQALVYLNRDSTYHPDSLHDEFDKKERADAVGEVHFDNIEPGRYYLFAEGRETGKNTIVRGIDSVIVNKRQRQNAYDVRIRTSLK